MPTLYLKKMMIAIALSASATAGTFAAEPPKPQSLTPEEAFAAVKEEFGVCQTQDPRKRFGFE